MRLTGMTVHVIAQQYDPFRAQVVSKVDCLIAGIAATVHPTFVCVQPLAVSLAMQRSYAPGCGVFLFVFPIAAVTSFASPTPAVIITGNIGNMVSPPMTISSIKVVSID